MKNLFSPVLLFAAFPAVASAQNTRPTVTVTRWPEDRLAAISLTFDDGISSDLDFVGPILKRHHLKGTFFLTTGMGPWEKRKSEWRQLARDGNEIANHTVHHPCLLEQITPHSQDYTPAMFEAEIRDAALDLTKTLDTTRGLTFAYPCGSTSFGKPQDEVANAVLYLQYVSEHAFAARAVNGGPVNPDELNALAVGDLGPTEGKGSPALLAQAQPAFDSRNWGVFCFHGVGGDWFAITPQALDELAASLERHPDVWTAPFGDVIRYIQERKALGLKITGSSPDSLELALEWPMDRQIYDVPLTLKVQLPSVWDRVRATADGKPLEARVTRTSSPANLPVSATAIVLDVPAQSKSVHLAPVP